MAAKRKRLRAPSTRSQFTAVVEALRQEHRAVAEQVAGVRDEILRRMDERFDEVERRFETLELVVRDLGL